MQPEPTNMKRRTPLPASPPTTSPSVSQPPKKRVKMSSTTKLNTKIQNLFLIRCRDNDVPGATGPKDWDLVTQEFNENFKRELKQGYAWKTLQKRYGNVKKQVERRDAKYDEKFALPDGEEGDGGVKEERQENDEKDEIEEKKVQRTEVLAKPKNTTANPFTDIVIPPTVTAPNRKFRTVATKAPRIRKQETEQVITDAVTASPAPHPGFYTPSVVPWDQISPITRAKFHLRRRTDEPITFRFVDTYETSLTINYPQFIDTDSLMAASPSLAHQTSIEVPEDVTARTVNIFIQLISPHPSTHLPTHYLWASEKPVPGTYDRFGAILAEKISWTVDTLLSLLFFARSMNVHWIIDMVVDRLHWMFIEQNRVRDALSEQLRICAGGRLPIVSNPMDTLDAEDFGEDVLRQLDGDVPTMRFIADVLYALGGEANYAAVSPEVQSIFQDVEASHLETARREEFCARYHHHMASECYTSHVTYAPAYYIDLLYAMSSPQELIALSVGLSPVDSLASMLYSGSGDADKLKQDNSAPAMLQAEKMVLEMQIRLEEAKEALRTARDAGEAEKDGAIGQAKVVVEAMYGGSRVAKL